jgi:hypothetical protein
VILPALRQGIPIVTNIPLNADLVRKDFIHADFIVIEDMTQNDIINTPAGTLLINNNINRTTLINLMTGFTKKF